MLGEVEMEDAPVMMGKARAGPEHTQASGGHGEKVDRDQVPDMVGEERVPGLHHGHVRQGGPGDVADGGREVGGERAEEDLRDVEAMTSVGRPAATAA
jgi:hypothetical protein